MQVINRPFSLVTLRLLDLRDSLNLQALQPYILLTGFPENQHNPACFPAINTFPSVFDQVL